MAYAIGAALALGVAVFGFLVGLDRERAFYATVLIVTASYYLLFAVLAGAQAALPAEAAALALFVAVAVLGFRISPWFVAAGLAGHGLFDLARGPLIVNPGVPAWWPPFCIGFDVVAGAWVAWLTFRAARPAAPR